MNTTSHLPFKIGFLCLFGFVLGTRGADVIKAGFSERDITPDIGMEQPGGYGKVYHRTFHDPCKAHIAVFDDGKTTVALVGLDALTIGRSTVLAMRSEIERRVGIPGASVMIAATHSHSSGPTGMLLPADFENASPEVKNLALQESSMGDAGYLIRVTNEVVEGVKAAYTNRVPASLGFGSGREATVGFNRRLRMKNGQTWSHPGAMNPDIIEYAGPIDPEVGVVAAWDLAGNLLGAIVNFSCHATTNPGGISANWPGYMARTVQGALGVNVPIVFLQGASGDVTQVDNLSPFRTRPPEQVAQFVGGRVGAEVVKVILGLPRSESVRVDSRQKVWQIKRRPLAPERIAASREIIAKGKAQSDAAVWTFAKEDIVLDYLHTQHPAVEVEVQAIQVGPAVFVSNPAEYFVQYGLNIKKGSPFHLTFPVELANGCVGYVPTEEAFSEQGGGYETRLSAYSNLEITAGRQFEQAGVELANQMAPGALPEFARIPAHGQPWRYGNVRPELR